MLGILISSARHALAAGLIVCAGMLALWLAGSRIDGLGLVSFLVRWLHVLAGIVWVGMIWFVNFVQLAAVETADEGGRATIAREIAPRVATIFRAASHLTLATGIVLLLTTGYLLDRWVFASAVYIPPVKSLMLWGGSLAGLVMWGLVHLVIWPALRLLASDADTSLKARARARVVTCARINLLLAVPVTFVMVAAAHLY